MAERTEVTLAPTAQPVLIEALTEIGVEPFGRLTLAGRYLEDLLIPALGMPKPEPSWMPNTTLARVRIEITPITADQLVITVNRQPYREPQAEVPAAVPPTQPEEGEVTF